MKNQKLYLVDSWNNHRVIGEFNSIEEINRYLDNKEYTENWENTAETFDDFKDGFYTVDENRMKEAVKRFGSRKKQYWT